MLLNGVQHVAILTKDTDRLVRFYQEVFDATVGKGVHDGEMSLTFIDIGSFNELNVFQIDGNEEAERQTPMFARGRIDHMGLRAASLEAFDTIRDRLIERRATDGFVTDFGPALSLFFVDPDGLEGEVLVENPNHEPGVFHPPGTPAAGYERVLDLGRS
jgi:catechol 2,3-dioxygenase-like lactoylglutathione lyase family enzyme